MVSRLRWWALVGSVVIDADHVPLYTFAPEFSVAGGRPPTHSLVTVAVLLALGAGIARVRGPMVGLAIGVFLHLVRDVVTGPGVPALWPVSATIVRFPYPTFLGLLSAAGVVATVVRWPRVARS
jgi:inner membrane protein